MNGRGAAIAGLVVLLAVGPVFPAPAGAPGPSGQAGQAPPSPKPLQYEVNVVLKLIQVHVTNKKGDPVRDLTRADFAVTDNGQPVTLTDFERRVLEPAVTVPGEPPAAGAAGDHPAGPVNPPTGRKFFLFFDFAYNNVRGIQKARTAALHFLDTIVSPEDEVAVLTYAGVGGIGIPEFLTTDHTKVRKVLRSIGHQDIKGRATEIEDYYWRLVQATGGPFATNFRSEAEVNRLESRAMAQKYMLTLTDLARALRIVDGEKNFILFSTGIPSSLIYGYATGNVFNRSDVGRASGDHVLRRQNEAMYKEFGAAGCAFYAFDTREAAKEASLFAYDEQSFAVGSRALTTAVDTTYIFKDEKTTGLNSLKRFTDRTGGRYYSNINLYKKNLGQVQEATGVYYVLGYSITEKWDGRFHEVNVEVKRKGCEVRTQAGYFNPKPFAEYTDLEKRIHLFDLAINERSFSRMPGNVPMTALSYAADGISRLTILAGVPGEVTSKFTGPKVELVALFFDGDGDIREIVREESDPASWRGRDMVLAAGAALHPGDYAGRLVIRDMTTGQSAVASARATVGKPAAAGLQLGTPLLLAEGTGMSVREAGGKKAAESPPFGEGYPYDASRFSPVFGEMPLNAAQLAVVFPCAAAGGGGSDLLLSACLVDAVSGAQVPATFSLSGRVMKGPLEVLTLDLATGGIPPGTHYLHVYAKDRRSGALGHTFTTLTVPAR